VCLCKGVVYKFVCTCTISQPDLHYMRNRNISCGSIQHQSLYFGCVRTFHLRMHYILNKGCLLLKQKHLRAYFPQKLSLEHVKLTVLLRVIISRVIVCQSQLRGAVSVKQSTLRRQVKVASAEMKIYLRAYFSTY
jgi:hypothetical protein